jgi:MurE/MurF fusion protein
MLNKRCGIIGTLGVGEPGSTVSTGLTTPDTLTMHRTLRNFIDVGYTACALEASSIGLVEQRLNGVEIDVALFTNFTQDHLDYHGSMEQYWDAKRLLFSWPSLKAAVLNIDDAKGAQLQAELANSTLDLWSVSTSRSARLQAKNISYTSSGVTFAVTEGNNTVTVSSTLIGEYNVSNILLVLGGLRAQGFSLEDGATVASRLTPVPGRLEPVLSDNPNAPILNVPKIVVDYAHTPDALEKVLQALRPVAQGRNGKLWCVFGCGGNRDASKRPRMGGIAARLADYTIITSDNPRLELPATILAQVAEGAKKELPTLKNITVIEDRSAAIAHAIAHASTNDVILLAGKGHEDYQDIGGVKRPYSDFLAARAALKTRLESTPS